MRLQRLLSGCLTQPPCMLLPPPFTHHFYTHALMTPALLLLSARIYHPPSTPTPPCCSYGAGPRQLASEVGSGSLTATERLLAAFVDAHPQLFAFKAACEVSAVARGFTTSGMGRLRTFRFQAQELRALFGKPQSDLPVDKALRHLARSRDDAHALRQACNAPVQGTAADILKAAVVALSRELAVPPFNCRLLLTVHDEVLMEVPEAQLQVVREAVPRIMCGVLPQLGVPLAVNVSVGRSWLEAAK